MSRYSMDVDKNFFLVLIAIFLSASPLIEGAVKAAVMLVLLVYLVLSLGGRFNVNKIEVAFLLCATFVFVLSMLVDFYYAIFEGLNTLSLFYIIGSFFIGFFLAKHLTLTDFMDNYEVIVRFSAFFSLIIFFILHFQPDFINFFFDYSYYHTSHKSLVLYNHVASARNAGFASEPGLYQFFVGLALWWRILRSPKFDVVVLIYAITLLTTKSTAGFFVLLVLLLPLIKLKNIATIALIVFFSYGLFIEELLYHLENKLWQSTAFEGRYIPMMNAFQLFIENPFGLGSIRYTSFLLTVDIGSYDSFSQASLRFGILGLLLLLFMIFNIATRSFVLAAILFITSTSQVVWLSPVMVCLYFALVRTYPSKPRSLSKDSIR